MKKISKKLSLTLITSFTLLFASSLLAQALDRVVATIDGEPILESEVVKFAKSKSSDQNLVVAQDQLRDFTQQYVSDQLLQREAVAIGVRVLDEEVAGYVEEIKKKNGVSDEQFNQLLLERGILRETYDRQVKIDLLKSRIVSRQIRSAITISTEQIERYLEENPDRRPAVGSVKLAQIFVPSEKEEGIIGGVEKAVAEGMAFEQAGGVFFSEVDFVDPNDLREELLAEIKKLKVGERSKAIKTSVGTYFIQLVSRVDKDGKIDGEIAEDIRNELYEKEFQGKLDNYLTVELPKKYLVEFKL